MTSITSVRAGAPADAGGEPELGGLFTSAEWLSAWERATVERVSARRYLHVDAAGSAPVTLPFSLIEASPLWRAYEQEAQVAPVWDRAVVFLPSLYAFYGPASGTAVRAVADALATIEAQARDWDAQAVVVANLPGPLARVLSARRPPAARVRLDTSYRIELPDRPEAYFASLKRDHRADLRRRRRRAGERGVVFSEVRGAEARARVPEFLGLADASAGKHGTESIYDAATLRAMLDVPGARLLLAERGGEILAGFLAFVHGSCLTLWSGGIRYEALREFSPCVFLLYETIALAYERSWDVLDFGRGNGAFKARHGGRPIALWSLFYLPDAGDPAIARLAALHERLGAAGAATGCGGGHA